MNVPSEEQHSFFAQQLSALEKLLIISYSRLPLDELHKNLKVSLSENQDVKTCTMMGWDVTGYSLLSLRSQAKGLTDRCTIRSSRCKSLQRLAIISFS